ncbi:hypothetical protein roselon_02286 [Roseibacterium elongatum DSM 19469]|uniref:Uncharacterized protein n=1 Tax=Roseicyclus elongatus DSM 19469 TaxID=1294273 RepID=W8S341_9RHOB|nr:hypothetical protein roselon_02286 [Roseibacterium elongatum DSM 19469]
MARLSVRHVCLLKSCAQLIPFALFVQASQLARAGCAV